MHGQMTMKNKEKLKRTKTLSHSRNPNQGRLHQGNNQEEVAAKEETKSSSREIEKEEEESS